MSTCENTFVSVGYRYDPTHPTHALVDAANYSAFSGGSLSLTVAATVLALGASLRILGQEVGEMEHCGLAHRSMLVRKRHPVSHGLLHHRWQRLRLLVPEA